MQFSIINQQAVKRWIWSKKNWHDFKNWASLKSINSIKFTKRPLTRPLENDWAAQAAAEDVRIEIGGGERNEWRNTEGQREAVRKANLCHEQDRV